MIETKPLEFNFTCILPQEYRGRNTRFVIDYSQATMGVEIPNLNSFFDFKHNPEKKRISFKLPDDGTTKHCQFSRNLISTHPNCEKFLTLFKHANPHLEDVYINYYVMDENGINTAVPDVTTNTTEQAINDGKDRAFYKYLLPIGIGIGVFYYLTKKPGKRRK